METEQSCYTKWKKILNDNVRINRLVFGMIGGTDEKDNCQLITTNLYGIFLSDTNRPDLNTHIFYVYEDIIPKSMNDFYNRSKQKYTIYKELINNKFYYIVVFIVNPKYQHDYRNFKDNKAQFATNIYKNDLHRIFDDFATSWLIENIEKNYIKMLKDNKDDLILNLNQVPLNNKGEVKTSPLFV